MLSKLSKEFKERTFEQKIENNPKTNQKQKQKTKTKNYTQTQTPNTNRKNNGIDHCQSSYDFEF
eukprot:m.179962 g.179962  ORF g.179962 m.179962 type:complete len:64 (+) comp31997_c1_seq1:1171-1362(+)